MKTGFVCAFALLSAVAGTQAAQAAVVFQASDIGRALVAPTAGTYSLNLISFKGAYQKALYIGYGQNPDAPAFVLKSEDSRASTTPFTGGSTSYATVGDTVDLGYLEAGQEIRFTLVMKSFAGGAVRYPSGETIPAIEVGSDAKAEFFDVNIPVWQRGAVTDVGGTRFIGFEDWAVTRRMPFDPAAAANQTTVFDHQDIVLSLTAAAVPEPATWAMMIGGFGLVGGAMRRRPSTTMVAA